MPGHVRVRYASGATSGMGDWAYIWSAWSWPMKMSGMARSTVPPSTSVATTPKQKGFFPTYGRVERVDRGRLRRVEQW